MALQVEKVYETIKLRIMDGTYSPSERLVESELAQELGVSRSTIKKALMHLANEGLVVIEANKGARIKSLSLTEVMDLLEVREMMEGLIAYKTAQVITDKDLNAIRSVLSEMKVDLNEGKQREYTENNVRFHEMIYEACPNDKAVEIAKSLKLQLRRYSGRTILIAGRAKESYSEHSMLLEAFEKHNSHEAEHAMRFHISNMRKTLKENYTLLF